MAGKGSSAVWVWPAVAGPLVLLAPWLQVKANRIVEGTNRSLVSDDPVWGAFLLAFWVLPLVLAVVGVSRRTVVRVAWAGWVFLPCLLVWAAGNVAAPLAPPGSFARIAPSWAFWVTLLGAYGGAVVLAPRTGLPRVWVSVAAWLFPLTCVLGMVVGAFSGLSLWKEYEAQGDVFWAQVLTHLFLSGVAVAVGAILGTVMGWTAHRLVKFRQPAFFFLNLVQTLPSLALFGLLIVPLAALGFGGIGPAPALVALSLYAAFPVARSTVTALDHLDWAVLDAGRGLGMSPGQIFFRVQVPLALPVVLEGIRTASVQAVGNTVVAALIGAGGLGSLVFLGLGQYAPDLILLGTLPVMVLALGLDRAWALVLRRSQRRVRT